MHNKQTKRALLASVLSLAICVAMLVGTTFAWFTDSVVSGKNTIVAGNLDVELEYATADGTGALSGWKSVDGATNLFADGLWEPGYAQVVYLRVSNLGTLALKYQFSLNITSETPGTNVNGEQFLLSDYLQYGVVDGRDTAFATRAEAIAAVQNPAPLDTYTKAGNLAAGADPQYVALVVYMPETVGNEANYRGNTIPTIELGLNLTATQDTVESDSFDNQYDAGAAVSTEAELKAALEKGGVVEVWDNISVTQRLTVSADTVLDLNGQTISFAGEYANVGADGDCTPIRVESGSLTITDGIIDATTASDYVVPVSVMKAGASLTIDNATIQVDTPRESCVFAMGGTVIINGGTFINTSTQDYEYGDGAPLVLNLSNGTPGIITVYGGTFVGRDPALGDDNLGGTFVADGYTSVQTGENTYTVYKGSSGSTEVELNNAISAANDGDIVYVGQNLSPNSTLTIDKSITLNLGNKIVDGTNNSSDGIKLSGTEKEITIMADSGGVQIDNKHCIVVNTTGSVITVDGGIYSVVGTSDAYLMEGRSGDSNVVTIQNVTYSGERGVQFSLTDNNTIYIKDCTFNTFGYSTLFIGGNNNVCTLENVTVEGAQLMAADSSHDAGGAYSIIYIKSGYYDCSLTASTGCTISITGGTFTKNPTNYVAEGYQAVYNTADRTWTVVAE